MFLDIMICFFQARIERGRLFVKAGGYKRMRGLPKFLQEKDEINKKLITLNGLIGGFLWFVHLLLRHIDYYTYH